MNSLFTSRMLYLAIFLACAALLGYAFYLQHVEYLEPCPLCIFQRIAFFFIAGAALIGAIHGPGRGGALVYTGLIAAGALAGVGVAGRHLWLQSLPPDQVPACGPGLEYMVEQFPLSEVLAMVFTGSGSCATIDWSFLGLSMPAWTLIWYLLLLIAGFIALQRARRSQSNG